MIYTIDRIEGDMAVLESPERKMQDVPLSALPAAVREGDALKFENGAWCAVPNFPRREELNARFAKLVK